MTAQQTDAITDPQGTSAALQQRLDAALLEKAALAEELAARAADLRESLEYQTATSDVLKVISRSTHDLQPVLNALVRTAARLCDADQAAIGRPDGDLWRLAAECGFPPEFETSQRARGAYALDPSTAAARAVREQRPVQIDDASSVPGYPEIFTRIGRQRTSLGVPLLRAGESIGFIVLARQRMAPFTDRQIELVSTFANQAVIAIENARLLTEQREALEQQTATSEVLQVINNSPGNLTPVFDAMLEKAMRLCEAAFGGLATFDGERFIPVALRGVPAAYADYRMHTPVSDAPGLIYGRIRAGATVAHTPDLKAEKAYQDGDPDRRAVVDIGGARSSLFVALRKDDALLGALQVYRQEVRPFSDRQIALLENFAAQAVIAIENARLLTETREALEQQTATAEILRVISSSPADLQPTFDAIAAAARTLTGAALGSVVTYDGRLIHVAALAGFTPTEIEKIERLFPIPADHGTATGRAILTRQATHIEDLAADPEHAYPTLAQSSGQTVLAVPMLRDGIPTGAINVQRRGKEPFTDMQIGLIGTFADQAVIAMENARLLNELRQRTGDLQESLEYQTATSDVLKVISRTTFDLQPVLAMVAETTARLCIAERAAIFSFEGGMVRLVANFGFPPEYQADFDARGLVPLDPVSPGVLPRAARERRAVHVHDAAAVPGYSEAAIKLGNVRTALGVPLLREGEPTGVIVLSRQRVAPFTDRQIELVSTFADQAVIAIENTRLLNEQREALEHQTATAEVLGVINASPGELQPVFDAMVGRAMRLCEASMGELALFEGEDITTVAMRGVPSAHVAFRSQPKSIGDYDQDTIPTRLLAGERILHIPDLTETDAYRRSDASRHALVHLANARSVLAVALSRESRILGWIQVSRPSPGRFSKRQTALLENFAAQAVIAIENARLLNEIRQRQEELRITFENMGDGVAMFDDTPRLVAWNRKFQELLDVPDATLAERRTYAEYIRYLTERGEFGPDTDEETQLRRLQERMREHYSFERTRPDGRVIEVRHNPVPDGGFVLIYADITERKRSEAEIRAARDAAESAFRELKVAQASLIQAEKMASLGQLTAGIAHEIKNPLNFVNNFGSLSVELLDELKETIAPALATLENDQRANMEDISATLTSNLEKIVQHGQRADGIVRGMLEHSRGTSGERRTVDLNTLVEETLNLAYHGARAQDQSFSITLERDLGEGIAPIELTPQDMTRVLLNLLSNGFYATKKRAHDGADTGFAPTVKVSTRDVGDAVEIRVRDNGTGIPTDIQDKLFQPFFTTKPTGEGTGLGLSISYDIVTQQHGGTITVESEPNAFTEFMIRLPRK